MASGGPREATPGTAYPNRTDLNAPKPPILRIPGQGYGEQAAQIAQQQAVPGPPPGVQGGWEPPPAPTPLHAPTERPDEPVTAGLATGPGPGPEALGLDGRVPLLAMLRAAYDAFPSPELLRLLLDEEIGNE